jgi:hypothetical protein
VNISTVLFYRNPGGGVCNTLFPVIFALYGNLSKIFLVFAKGVMGFEYTGILSEKECLIYRRLIYGVL